MTRNQVGPPPVAEELGTATADSRAGHQDSRAAADADLAEVIDRWPTVPEAIRRATLALVRSAS